MATTAARSASLHPCQPRFSSPEGGSDHLNPEISPSLSPWSLTCPLAPAARRRVTSRAFLVRDIWGNSLLLLKERRSGEEPTEKEKKGKWSRPAATSSEREKFQLPPRSSLSPKTSPPPNPTLPALRAPSTKNHSEARCGVPSSSFSSPLEEEGGGELGDTLRRGSWPQQRFVLDKGAKRDFSGALLSSAPLFTLLLRFPPTNPAASSRVPPSFPLLPLLSLSITQRPRLSRSLRDVLPPPRPRRPPSAAAARHRRVVSAEGARNRPSRPRAPRLPRAPAPQRSRRAPAAPPPRRCLRCRKPRRRRQWPPPLRPRPLTCPLLALIRSQPSRPTSSVPSAPTTASRQPRPTATRTGPGSTTGATARSSTPWASSSRASGCSRTRCGRLPTALTRRSTAWSPRR